MNRPADYLYKLLPETYRMRDAGQGFPLRSLLAVLDEQGAILEGNIDELYANWFIETAADWVVPYLGDLLGYRPVHDAGLPGTGATAQSLARNKILTPRREVANTVNFRRRKGTLALLADLAQAVAAWPGHAVEFAFLLGRAEQLNHQHPGRGGTADLRNGAALDLDGGPLGSMAHTVDVRSPVSTHARGRYNIPSIGLFAGRLQSYSVTDSPACCVEKEGNQCFTFSVLGHDTPLFTAPADSPAAGPEPIQRRAFTHLLSLRPPVAAASPSYYGPGHSITVTARGWRGAAAAPLGADTIIPADLRNWHAYKAPRNKVLVDPVRGRMIFPAGQLPRGVTVDYHYGFSTDMGGGEYPRALANPDGATIYRVRRERHGEGEFPRVMDAHAQWLSDRGTPDPLTGLPQRAAVIEIMDSRAYEERFEFVLVPGESLQLRAADGARPVLRLLDYRVDQPDPLSVTGGDGARFTLDGLLIVGRGLAVNGPAARRPSGDGEDPTEGGDLCDVTIRHCTLVPGWNLDCDCEPQRPEEASIVLDASCAALALSHSILGPIQVQSSQDAGIPPLLTLADCLWDATTPTNPVLSDATGGSGFRALRIQRCTVIGQARTHVLTLAEDTLFLGVVAAARRQLGCVRFCYVPPGSGTPRRYHCQPDLVRQAVADAAAGNAGVDPAQLAAAQNREVLRVRPALVSVRYGNPGYGQLAPACAAEITSGADDEAELGAFHDLFQPQRAANLRARLDDYTVAGYSTGIFYTS